MSVDLIRYDLLVQDALRGVVRRVLTDVARDGLPGDHHLYVSFDTTAPGVRLSARLKERYPEEMTIVLQHQFWDLIVTETFFEVGLSFNGIPERLHVPFAGLKGFFDPSVKFGLQFEPMAAEAAEDEEPAPEPAPAPATVSVVRPTSVPSTRAPSVGEAKPAGRKPEPAAPFGVAPARSDAGKPDAGKPDNLKVAPSKPETVTAARPAPVPAGDEAGGRAPAKPAAAKPVAPAPAAAKPPASAGKPAADPAAGARSSGTVPSEPADGSSGDGEGKGAQVVRLDAFRKK